MDAGQGHDAEVFVVGLHDDGAIDAPVPRMLAHQAPGMLHLAVSLQIVDPSGGWLVQRRAESKALFPGRWANSCCTHPMPGEDPATAAVRRALEEVGLAVDPVTVVPAGAFTYRAEDPVSGFVEHELDHVFVAIADTSGIAADAGEIDELAVLPYEEALALVTSAGAPWAGQVLERARAALSPGAVPSGG